MGLNDEEVILSRRKNGSNIITQIKKRTFIDMLVESFADPIIKILLIALGVKLIFLFKSFDIFETLGILIAVLLATLISTLSEYGSEAAFSKLEESNDKIQSKVYRNGKLILIDFEHIVVGDTIILSSGDKVPADGHIIDGELSIDESSLNGESREIKKISVKNNDIKKENCVYRGTIIYNGSAKVLITAVGDKTLCGEISEKLSEKTIDSPLKVRLFKLANKISLMGYIGAFLATFAYLFMNIVVKNNFDWLLILSTLKNADIMIGHLIYCLTLCVTIIVVAVPEGLPLMITLVLSKNMKKMIKKNVLVRKMVGIETAGSLNLLLTDKTGTLTKGVLEVSELVLNDNYRVNKFSNLNNEKLKEIIFLALYYNNECILSNDEIIGGNSSDKAFMNFIKSENLKYNAKVIETKPFDSNTKYSSVTVKYKNEKISFVKGAPEIILSKCTKYLDKAGNEINLNTKRYVNKLYKNLVSDGSRIIAIAKIDNYNNYIFIAFAAIKDEIRDEAQAGVKKIQEAGVNIIMITGDSVDTGSIIAKKCGIIKDVNDIVLSSEEFNSMTDTEIANRLNYIKVIARALPTDKGRLVSIAQNKNLVVAMTGDGVNDAIALKKADVGFAMGSGTEVAKNAGDIVILDDNINSISTAILYGRTIFKNIRKFIIYQLTVNVSALIISIIGTFIGISEPITIMQMLWLNMIMDTFAGIAFASEPALEEYMKESPKNKNEEIINNYMYSQIIVGALFISSICLIFLKGDIIKLLFNDDSNQILYTAYFALFIFIGIFNAFNSRTHRINIFAGILKNKAFIFVFTFIFCMQIFIIYNGGSIFRTYGLASNELIFVILISASILPIDFLRKIYLKTKGQKKGV